MSSMQILWHSKRRLLCSAYSIMNKHDWRTQCLGSNRNSFHTNTSYSTTFDSFRDAESISVICPVSSPLGWEYSDHWNLYLLPSVHYTYIIQQYQHGFEVPMHHTVCITMNRVHITLPHMSFSPVKYQHALLWVYSTMWGQQPCERPVQRCIFCLKQHHGTEGHVIIDTLNSGGEQSLGWGYPPTVQRKYGRCLTTVNIINTIYAFTAIYMITHR